jgi:dienelactone hydrolase
VVMRPLAMAIAVISAALNSSPAAAAPATTGVARLQAAQSQMTMHYDEFVRLMGPQSAADLTQRLDDDIGYMMVDETPSNFTAAEWQTRLNGLAALDSSIVEQIVSGRHEPIAGSRGLVERLIVTRIDHTVQPFALYVPALLPAHPSLVVLLHGNPQTEAEILSGPYFQRLADQTQTVVVAPWGRGIYNFAPPADDEVYQVTDAVVSALDIDPHRVYLAGYSMGGFTVFKIGPEHAAQWAAVMCIAGSVLNSGAAAVKSALAHTRMYIVNGAKDDNIPPRYGEGTAQWLAGVGIATGFYQQPDGTHYLTTLTPVLSQAWHEMLGGYISAQALVQAGTSGQGPAEMLPTPAMGTGRSP